MTRRLRTTQSSFDGSPLVQVAPEILRWLALASVQVSSSRYEGIRRQVTVALEFAGTRGQQRHVKSVAERSFGTSSSWNPSSRFFSTLRLIFAGQNKLKSHSLCDDTSCIYELHLNEDSAENLMISMLHLISSTLLVEAFHLQCLVYLSLTSQSQSPPMPPSTANR